MSWIVIDDWLFFFISVSGILCLVYEILEHLTPALRRERLRMELDALYGVLDVAQAHYRPTALGGRGHDEACRKARRIHDK